MTLLNLGIVLPFLSRGFYFFLFSDPRTPILSKFIIDVQDVIVHLHTFLICMHVLAYVRRAAKLILGSQTEGRRIPHTPLE